MKLNNDQNSSDPSFNLNERIRKCDEMMTQYWNQNPDLLKAVEEKKETAKMVAELWKGFQKQPAPLLFPKVVTPPPPLKTKPPLTDRTLTALNRLNQLKQSPLLQWAWVDNLKTKISTSQKTIHENIVANHSEITHRTNAHNRKCTFHTVDEERRYPANLLQDQLRVWKKVIPNLLRKFSQIPDPRKPAGITHKKTVLMMYGLLAFVFKISSCREMNRELSSAVVFDQLKTIFPDIDSIPHACTLTRFLEKIQQLPQKSG